MFVTILLLLEYLEDGKFFDKIGEAKTRVVLRQPRKILKCT